MGLRGGRLKVHVMRCEWAEGACLQGQCLLGVPLRSPLLLGDPLAAQGGQLVAEGVERAVRRRRVAVVACRSARVSIRIAPLALGVPLRRLRAEVQGRDAQRQIRYSRCMAGRGALCGLLLRGFLARGSCMRVWAEAGGCRGLAAGVAAAGAAIAHALLCRVRCMHACRVLCSVIPIRRKCELGTCPRVITPLLLLLRRLQWLRERAILEKLGICVLQR